MRKKEVIKENKRVIRARDPSDLKSFLISMTKRVFVHVIYIIMRRHNYSVFGTSFLYY